MKKLIVDMDGVLVDVYANFLRIEKERYGCVLTDDDLAGVQEEKAFPHCIEIVNSVGFFRDAPLMEGSVRALETLNKSYDVRIVSSAMEFPGSLREKFDWLGEHFPFIRWQQITLCGTKDIIKGDIMIDDHPSNLRTFEGDKIIFSQPHNVDNTEFRRAAGWADVLEMIG